MDGTSRTRSELSTKDPQLKGGELIPELSTKIPSEKVGK